MNPAPHLAGLFLALLLWAGAAWAAPREWVFVVHPFDTPSRVYERFRPLSQYLGAVAGRPMRLTIAATYEEQIEMIADGRAQIAYLGPTPYVRARERAVLDILAGEAEAGQAFYQSAIVARADGPIHTLADLKGKRVALGAEISLGSSVAPQLMLAQAGVKPATLTHLDRHERVALAVLHGDFDAGGLRLDLARPYLPRGLRVIAVSPPLPPHVIAAAPGLPAALKEALRAALLHPDAAGVTALRALGGDRTFVAVEDSHYHSVRRMLKTRPRP